MYRQKTSILVQEEQPPKVMDFITRAEQDRFDFDRLIRKLKPFQNAPLHIRYTIANDVLSWVKYPGIPENVVRTWLNATLKISLKRV